MQAFSQISNDGLSIFDIYTDELSYIVFLKGIKDLTDTYCFDYLLERPTKVKNLYKALKDLKYSNQKYEILIKKFSYTNKFKEWEVADVLSTDIKQPKLYPRTWMKIECQKNSLKEFDFESYDIPGYEFMLYRYPEVEPLDPVLFPRWNSRPPVEKINEMSGKMKESVNNDVVEMYNMFVHISQTEAHNKKLILENIELRKLVQDKDLLIEKLLAEKSGINNKKKPVKI